MNVVYYEYNEIKYVIAKINIKIIIIIILTRPKKEEITDVTSTVADMLNLFVVPTVPDVFQRIRPSKDS
jgi:hypothetical protein